MAEFKRATKVNLTVKSSPFSRMIVMRAPTPAGLDGDIYTIFAEYTETPGTWMRAVWGVHKGDVPANTVFHKEKLVTADVEKGVKYFLSGGYETIEDVSEIKPYLQQLGMVFHEPLPDLPELEGVTKVGLTEFMTLKE